MKSICIILLACVAYSVAAVVDDHQNHQFKADKTFLERQKQILRFYVRMQYPTVFKEIKDIADTYKPDEHLDKYDKPENVKMFMYLYKNNKLMPRGEVFSDVESYTKERTLMVDILYYAKDYDSFYKTACWARDRVHELVYFYSLTAVVYYREDTKYMKTPPMYEVYPFMFVNEKVIQKAMDYYMTSPDALQGKPYVINVNSTDNMNHELDHENAVSYFREDVGLNEFNFYWHIRYPNWYNSTQYGFEVDRRGELFLHVQHQLLSRYFMERMSNYLDEVPYMDCDKELPGFYPGLRYHSGQEVIGRPEGLKMRDTNMISVHYMDELFQRIRMSIDRCYILTDNNTKVPICNENGINVLGDLLFSTGDNPGYKWYGSFYNFMLYMAGKVSDPEDKLASPRSLLMQLSGMLRDPLYYQMIHTMYNEFVYKLRKNLPMYTYEDLLIPGVKIDNVELDELVTYFDDFYINLSNVIGVRSEDEMKNIDIRVKMQRLNHKPFNYRVLVTSDKEMDVHVKVFMVPMYDVHGRKYNFETRMMYPVEIDTFPYKLNAGETVIERNSKESTVAVKDPDSFRTMYKKVTDALDDKVPLMVNKYSHAYGFPQRLLIPKGWKSGMPVRLIVRLFPYRKAEGTILENTFEVDSMTMMGMPYGYKYPMTNRMNMALDRVIRSLDDAKVPNAFMKEVLIYHKSQEDMTNVVNDMKTINIE